MQYLDGAHLCQNRRPFVSTEIFIGVSTRGQRLDRQGRIPGPPDEFLNPNIAARVDVDDRSPNTLALMQSHVSPEPRNLAGAAEHKSFFLKQGRYLLCVVISVTYDDIGERLG